MLIEFGLAAGSRRHGGLRLISGRDTPTLSVTGRLRILRRSS